MIVNNFPVILLKTHDTRILIIVKYSVDFWGWIKNWNLPSQFPLWFINFFLCWYLLTSKYMCKCNEWNEVSFLVDYSFQFHQFSFTDLLCSALILNFLPLQPLAFSSDMSKQCKPFSQKTFMFLSPLLHRYRNRPKMCFFGKKLSVSPSHYTLARSILLSFLLGRHQRRKYERVRYSAFRMSNKYQLLIWRSIFIYTRNQSDCKHCSWKCPSKFFFLTFTG